MRVRSIWSWKALLVPTLILAAIAAVTLPGIAKPSDPTKLHDIAVREASAPANTTGVSFTVRVKNVTEGNSNFNSLSIALPTGFTATGAMLVAPDDPGEPDANWRSSNPNASAAVDWSAGTRVDVTSLDPVNSGSVPSKQQWVVVRVTVTTSPVPGCLGSAGTWAATVWTGGNLSGQNFILRAASNTTTTLTVSCALAIDGDPATDAIEPIPNGNIVPPASNALNVTVKVLKNGSVDASYSGTITLAEKTPPSGSLSIVAGAQSGGTRPFSISGSAAGDYVVTASATGLSSVDSNTFTLYAGDIDCGDTREGGALIRGRWNKDGSTCVIVDYTFDDHIASRNEVTLEWDTASQPTAAFEYTATWQPEDATLPPARTEVSYRTDGNGDRIWEDGEACWSDGLGSPPTPRLPDPYATLSGAMTDATTSISVTRYTGQGAAPGIPTTPFDFVIGTERLTATAISGNTWTVVRGVGGTTAASHADGVFVMSTPLPIVGGAQVPMCIASEGWSGSGPGEIVVTSRIFDIGDGGVRRR